MSYVVVVIPVLAGGVFYFIAQQKTDNTVKADGFTGVAALPLINKATAIGVTAIVAQCD